MTINDLVRRLVDRLTVTVADFRLESPDGPADRPPFLVAGWLPPKRSTTNDDHPVLVVRPATGTITEGSLVTVKLLIGTFGESTEGWQDLGNVVQRIVNDLLGGRALGPFCLELPLTWTIYDEQPLPQWAAEIITVWAQPSVEWTGETQ